MINFDSLTCLTDLHIHLDGSISLNNLKQLASLQHIELPSDEVLIKKISQNGKSKDLNEFLAKFAYILEFLQTKEALELATYNLCEELVDQGLMYAELRFGPELHGQKGMSQIEAVDAVRRGILKSRLTANIILCICRGTTVETAKETIDIAEKYGYPLDLCCAEALYPTCDYRDLFLLAKCYGVKFTIHAGEALGHSSIDDAISFGTLRIGHGVRCIESEETLQKLHKKRIMLEVCPTSNVYTSVFKDYDELPIKELLKYKVGFSINTDDPALLSTNIRNEWKRVVEVFNLTDSQVKDILKRSVKYSFAENSLKDVLYKQIEKEIKL